MAAKGANAAVARPSPSMPTSDECYGGAAFIYTIHARAGPCILTVFVKSEQKWNIPGGLKENGHHIDYTIAKEIDQETHECFKGKLINTRKLRRHIFIKNGGDKVPYFKYTFIHYEGRDADEPVKNFESGMKFYHKMPRSWTETTDMKWVQMKYFMDPSWRNKNLVDSLKHALNRHHTVKCLVVDKNKKKHLIDAPLLDYLTALFLVKYPHDIRKEMLLNTCRTCEKPILPQAM